MKINYSPISKIKQNDENKLKNQSFGSANLQEPENNAEKSYPKSDVLKAYAGIKAPTSNDGEDIISPFLDRVKSYNEKLYDSLIESMTNKDGVIEEESRGVLKSLIQKKNSPFTIKNIFVASNQDGVIDYKLLHFSDRYSVLNQGMGNPINSFTLIKQLKNKDGALNEKLYSIFMDNSKDLISVLKIRPDMLFSALKNNEGDYSDDAISYFKTHLENGERVINIINDIAYAKDKDGNFSNENLELSKYISNNFSQQQGALVKRIAFSLSEDKKQERVEFLKFAEGLKDDEDFDFILRNIDSLKKDELESKSNKNKQLNLGVDYNEETVKFFKNTKKIPAWAKEMLPDILKTINKPVNSYTTEDLEILNKLIFSLDKYDLESMLGFGIKQSGEAKGKFDFKTVEKYLDIYTKNRNNLSMDDLKYLNRCLSKEENDYALDTFHKLYNLTWNKDIGNHKVEERINRGNLKFILSLLCIEKEGKPTRQCYVPVMDRLNKLMTMQLPMSSKDAFENFMLMQDIDAVEKLEKVNFEELGIKTGQISKNVFKDATEEQLLTFKKFLKDYLSDKDVSTVDINLNKNIRTTVELTTGDYLRKTKLLFDISKGEPVSDILETHYSNNKNITQKDYKNNTLSVLNYKLIQKGLIEEYAILNSQSLKKFDDNGNMLYEEVVEPSIVDNVYNVRKIYPDGSVDVISEATKGKNGNELVEKKMESLDGTRTYYRYENDPMGNRILDYKITSKDGKTLLNQSVTFEVVDENHFVSSRNNKKFDIRIFDDTLAVKNMQTDETVNIELENFTKYTKDLILPLLKSIPGDELFNMKKLDLKALSVSDSVPNAAFSPKKEEIMTKPEYMDLGVILHEWGHGKDNMMFKEINEHINKDQNLRNIYKEEKENFRKHFGDAQLSHIGYFSSDYHYLGGDDAIIEGVAETNTILSMFPKNEVQGVRAHYWMQYFPRTIAYLAKLMY